jgi:hypothetical protein
MITMATNPQFQRLFVYGMQTSGASLFTYYLAQKPSTVAVIDLWAYYVAPNLRLDAPCIVKAVVTTNIALEQHLASYQPDCKILFLRDPVQNFLRLQTKEYRDIGGSPEEKLQQLERVYRQSHGLFDVVIRYEDFVVHPENVTRRLNRIGLDIPQDAHLFQRSLDAITTYNGEQSAWCRDHFGSQWWFGNIHVDALPSLTPLRAPVVGPHVADKLLALCPMVMSLYARTEAR